jgi:hypothetical protein
LKPNTCTVHQMIKCIDYHCEGKSNCKEFQENYKAISNLSDSELEFRPVDSYCWVLDIPKK